MTPPPGHLILVNGASSAGKTTLCRALRNALPDNATGPFLHFSLDFFMFDAEVLPRTPQGKVRDWPHIRPQVFGGFYRCLPALLEAGNNLVVDLITEDESQWDCLRELLAPHDVYLVGLLCPPGELERREAARGDRNTGEARWDAQTVHTSGARGHRRKRRPHASQLPGLYPETMPRRVLMPALLLSLLLTACLNQPPAPEPTPKLDPVEPPPPAACRTLGAAGGGLASVQGLSGQGLSMQRLAGPWPQAKSDWSAARVPGQVLVLQGSAGGNLSAQALRALSGVQMQAVVPGVQLARTPAGEDDRAFAQRLGAAGLRTQPNYVYRALALPNDPAFPGNVGLKVGGVNVFQTYLTRTGVPAAWDALAAVGKTPQGARIAVLDSAPDRSHPELQGRLQAGASCLAAGPNTGEVSASEHGTEVAGLIGANTNNGVGIAGVVWSGPMMGIQVLDGRGEGSTAILTAGLNYAVQQGARVINISLGGPGIEDAVLDAALTAAAKTAVIVAAAGNSATEGVYYPASHPDVIAVGALGSSDDALACYSARPNAQRLRDLDIVAPGGVGGRCPGFKPELNIPVLAVSDKVENQYKLEAGTSFSAPLVTGVVALMRGANPGLSAEQTRTLLLANVNRSGGLPVLDAAAAVRAALR